MQRRSRMLPAAAACLLVAGVALAQQSTVKPGTTVREIMQSRTIPLSTAVFEAASEPPKTAAQWAEVRDKALALAESGNLLMLKPRARDEGDWMTMARAHVDAAKVAATAADRKDADALSSAGDALYETCETCHMRYMNNDAPPK